MMLTLLRRLLDPEAFEVADPVNSRVVAGEDEEAEDPPDPKRCSLLVSIADSIKCWLSPSDESSKVRQSVSPITDCKLYDKYSKCAIDKVVQIIGFLSFVVCIKSFNDRPWWNETESCLGNACPVLWTVLVTLLYAKNLLLNLVGLAANAALVYGAYDEVADFVYLWLIWRSIAAALNVVTVAILLTFNLFVHHDLRPIVGQELTFLVTNVFLWVAVFAYYEQIRDGTASAGGGGGAAEEFDGGEAGSAAAGGAAGADDSFSMTEGDNSSMDEGFLVNIQSASRGMTAGLSRSSSMTPFDVHYGQQHYLPPRQQCDTEVTFSHTQLCLLNGATRQ